MFPTYIIITSAYRNVDILPLLSWSRLYPMVSDHHASLDLVIQEPTLFFLLSSPLILTWGIGYVSVCKKRSEVKPSCRQRWIWADPGLPEMMMDYCKRWARKMKMQTCFEPTFFFAHRSRPLFPNAENRDQRMYFLRVKHNCHSVSHKLTFSTPCCSWLLKTSFRMSSSVEQFLT